MKHYEYVTLFQSFHRSAISTYWYKDTSKPLAYFFLRSSFETLWRLPFKVDSESWPRQKLVSLYIYR